MSLFSYMALLQSRESIFFFYAIMAIHGRITAIRKWLFSKNNNARIKKIEERQKKKWEREREKKVTWYTS